MQTNNKTIFLLIVTLSVILAFGGYSIYTLNGKIEKQNSTIDELKEENNNLKNTIEDLNKADNKANTNEMETTIKTLFLAKIKKIDSENQEKLLDYRVDEVKILSPDEKKDIPSYGEYDSNAVFAVVTYSVKPKNIESSEWNAGNGEIENDWIVKKSSCEVLEDGSLGEYLATGW